MRSTPFVTKGQFAILLALGIIGGILLGSAGMYIALTQLAPLSPATSTSSAFSNPGIGSLDSTVLPGDGIFLLDGQSPKALVRLPRNASVDISVLPAITSRTPEIAIQGDDLPIGKLKLIGYKAGFGLDLEYSSTGATVRTVFDHSPAQLSNILPGDVIVSVDGKRPTSPNAYMPGHADLFGVMLPQVRVEILRGSKSSTVELARTYLHPSAPLDDMLTPYSRELSVSPHGDYVVLTPKQPLEPGVYHLGLIIDETYDTGFPILPGGPTSTPTVQPDYPKDYWVFLVTP